MLLRCITKLYAVKELLALARFGVRCAISPKVPCEIVILIGFAELSGKLKQGASFLHNLYIQLPLKLTVY